MQKKMFYKQATTGILFFLFLVQSALFNMDLLEDWQWLIPLFVVVFMICNLYRFVPILVFLLYTLQYIYVPKYYFVDSYGLSFHNFYESIENINFVAILNTSFFVGVWVGVLKLMRSNINKIIVYPNIECKLCFYFLYTCMFIMAVFGLSGDDLLISGVYASDAVNKTPIFEYCVAVLGVALIYIDKKSKFQGSLVLFFILYFITKSSLYGGRIEILQIALLGFYYLSDFVSVKKIQFAVLIILMYSAMTIIGAFRYDPVAFLENFSFLKIIDYVSAKPEIIYNISTQHGDVYYAALRIVGIVKDGFISSFDRLYSFFLLITSPVSTFVANDELSNLASFESKSLSTGGGGLITGFAYTWLSLPGPLIFGYSVGAVFYIFYSTRNIYLRLYSIIVLVSFPRWFAYYPVTFFKLCIFAVLVAMAINTAMNLRVKTKQI